MNRNSWTRHREQQLLEEKKMKVTKLQKYNIVDNSAYTKFISINSIWLALQYKSLRNE